MSVRPNLVRNALLAIGVLSLVLSTGYVAKAEPVVQPLPSAEVQRLNRALVSLAKKPRDLAALQEAGDAAIAVGDLEAAAGFFERAREIGSDSPGAELGLGRVALRQGNPVEAIALLERAITKGARFRDVLGERGLAYDMVGWQTRAQEDYRQLLEQGEDAEITRRLALSYAIEGRLSDFERALRPQIDRRDPAAFRARTFGLAIMGQETRAAAIVDAVMPARLANEMTSYLAVMPRLTPAQQAAAANLGIFPRPADVGRDTLQIAQFTGGSNGFVRAGSPATPRTGTMPAERVADARLAPQGAPLGSSSIVPSASASGEEPVTSEPPSEPPPSVSEVFADLDLSEGAAPEPAEGAVDLATIDIPREAPRQPKEPVHPSRIWVQVATGRDLEALAFDWRRLSRRAPDLLGGFTAHTARWGQANRLLAGPIPSARAARNLVNQLKEKGIDTFSYTSPEGSEITVLD